MLVIFKRGPLVFGVGLGGCSSVPTVKVRLSEVPAEMAFGLKHAVEGSEPMKGWAVGAGGRLDGQRRS